MKAVIMQPYYIPYRVFFHWLYRADHYVFLDTVQFVDDGWHNRNQIITPNGKIWLSVPVLKKHKGKQLIKDVQINNNTSWQKKHWKSIEQTYRKAPFFYMYANGFFEIYNRKWKWLVDLNTELIKLCARFLNIKHVTFHVASEMGIEEENPTWRVIRICENLGADHYISGPAAKSYMDIAAWEKAGIILEWHEAIYPDYPQLTESFDPFVSIIDLLFNCGDQAPDYIWGPDTKMKGSIISNEEKTSKMKDG